jgi:uncharacterized protein
MQFAVEMRMFVKIQNLLLGCTLCLMMLPIEVIGQEKDGLLWAVVQPGRKDTSYLLGTLHKFPSKVVEVPGIVSEKLNKCQSLYLEMTLDWRMVFKMITSKGGVYEANMSEDENWNEEDWEQIEDWFVNEQGMEEDVFRRIKNRPFGSRIMDLYLSLYGFDYSAVEEELKIMAKKERIPVKGLDKNWDEIQTWYAHYNNSNGYWASGNLDSLLADGYYGLADLFISYAIQDTATINEYERDVEWRDGLTLVGWRNKLWMKQLPKIMQQRNFVAVGAAHLYGETGVIHLLKQAGFSCLPVQAHFGGPKLERFIRRFSRKYQLAD